MAYTMYARTGIGAGEPAVIAGASPVARFLVEILRAKGVTPAVVVDPAHEPWIDWLLGRGAIIARVDPGGAAAEARATIATAIAAQGTPALPWRLFAVDAAAATRAAELAGARATLTVLAPAPDLPGSLAERELAVIGVAGAHPDLVVEVAAMCVKGEIDLHAGTVVGSDPDPAMRAIVHVLG